MTSTICICGAGTMGSGIAQLSATAGFTTVLYDVSEAVMETARIKIEKGLDILVDKKKITPLQRDRILDQLVFTSNINQCVADVVIEAVVEDIEVKTSLFNQLAAINAENTILATNTSSLSVSAIAKNILKPQRVAGLHFFNPAPVMKLVEIVKAEQSDSETVSKLIELTKKFGKTPVVCKDSPGFVVNRVARPFYIESLRLIEDGITDVETIDRLIKNNGFKMGPFELMDLVGNDINYAVSCSVYEQLNKPDRLKPSSIQKQKVERGELGRKSGKGFYPYN